MPWWLFCHAMVAVILYKSPTLAPAETAPDHTLPLSCLTVDVTHWGTVISPTQRHKKKSRVMSWIFYISIHRSITPSSGLQQSIPGVSWPMQASFSHPSLSDGFLVAARPAKSATPSLLSKSHSWDLLTTAAIKLGFKLLSCEPSITQAVDSRTLVFWFCCSFGSTKSLPVRVTASLEVEGNCTHWQLC